MPDNKKRELAKVTKILNENQRMNFVQRVLRPQEWPVLRNPDNTYSSHSMAFEHLGPPGKETPAVFPTVVFDPASKTLQRLPLEQAKQHAYQSGEFIAFNDPDEADWFAKNYKLGMGGGFVRP